jgi:carboxyl-terminal processing protease
VASDIVLPSIFDALEIGEEHLDHVLPFDRIRQAADFQPLAKENLFLPRLKELSDARVSKDQDMIYNRKDAEELKTRIKENQLSLKKDVRDKEITQAEIDRKARNAERKERFAQIEKIDKESMKFFKLTLDDVAKNRGPKAYEPSAENQDYMRRAKNDTEDLDDTPKWPSGMDLVKREGVAILADLVKVTEEARVAGLLK